MSSPPKLSARLERVAPSLTMTVTARAKELQERGVNVVSLSAGEPDFDTPDHIKEAARAALTTGCATYTHVAGIPALREQCAAELNRAHGLSLTADQVIVTTGAKQSLFNAFMALLNDGDEVIIPAPYWVSYPDMVKIAGGEPVTVPTDAGREFQLDASAIAKACTPRTRALVLNTPCNPTGAIYSRESLAAIAEIVVDKDLLVISDDIYRSLVYGANRYTSIASIAPEIARRVLLVDGVSKSYAMTGWRIGYAAGPKPLVQAMAKLQGQSTSNAAHIAQLAALAALAGPQECVARMRDAFDKRRRFMVAGLRAIPEITCSEPRGAFYAFPNISEYLGRTASTGRSLANDVALCEHLVEAGGVAIVPGTGFGAPGFARLSYATSMRQIELGIARMRDALAALV